MDGIGNNFNRKDQRMKIWQLAGSTALATLAFAGIAQADVTPEEVWADWQAMSTAWGQQVTATSQAREGDALVVKGIKLVVDQPDTRVEGEIDTVTFRDKGDGTVEITASDAYPLTITTTPPTVDGAPAAGPTTVQLNIVQNGMVMVASGDADNTRYEYTIPMLGIELGDVTTPDGTPDNTIDLKVAMNNVEGSYDLTGENRDMVSDGRADNMVITLAATQPNTDGSLTMNAEMSDLTVKSTAANMGTMAAGDMAAALKDGFTTLTEFAYAGSNMTFDFNEASNTATGKGTTGAGTLSVGMGEKGLLYAGTTTKSAMEIQASQLPFPMALAYDSSEFELGMPVSASDQPQDFTLVSKLEGLTVSDDVWALFDPAGVLPRDPATLVIDTSGTTTLAFDIMDPAAAEQMAGAAPGEINSLDVNELHLNIAGTDLTGQGGFTFDNSDLVTFDGIPAPTGKLDLRLVGGNALIDKAVQLGFVPEDQAMGARMMLGMFARMVEGETDTMTSEVELKDKHLFVNGQMLQ